MALCGHPFLFFVLCLSICPRPALGQPRSAPGQEAAISSRVGNSSAQTVGAQAFRTLDFRLFEHKIAIFVRFLPSEPPFWGISSTKSRFLCQKRRFFPGFGPFRAQNRAFCARRTGKVALGILKLTSGIPKVLFLQITAHTSKM